MLKDQYGNIYFDEDSAMDLLYQNPEQTFDNCKFVNSVSNSFNQAHKQLHLELVKLEDYVTPNVTLEEFDKQNQDVWYMPEEYQTLDIKEFITSLAQNQNEAQRLDEELREFEKRNLFPLLRYLKYLVDVMRENSVVWGVGRGSSVASFVLYKLGVHRIDSLKYNLDWKEFLR
jgi:DNA polymerase III alpha subunit